MSEDEINKQVSKETGSMSSVTVGIELDREALRGLRDSVKAINKEAKEMAINFKDALAALKEMRNDYGLTQVSRSTELSPGGTGGGAAQHGAAGTVIVGGRAQATQAVTPAPNAVTAALTRREVLGGGFAAGVSSAERFEGAKGVFGGGTGATGLVQQWAGGGFTTGGNFASMAGTLAKVGMQAIDARAEAGRGYALAADKSTLQMQQITGMSQREVMNNLRMPLTDYKLGTNGINQLMSLQARTGINAAQQASSVEFMRTLSGFSMGAEGASSIIENLADPETVNKMYMMTGMSLIGPGGKQRSTQSLIQNLAKRAGLDNKRIADSAMAPGSVTRSTLSAMGVSGDLQDQVIQYAQANVAFREKGGKGSYDPTKSADRKRMGIDDTFAMEAEETERKRGKRDEQFYRDQAGAYAKLERQTQTLTDAMAKLEHVIAPIISARTGNRIASKVVGGLASIAGGFAMGGPLGGILGAAGAIGSILGDPRPIGDDNTPWSTVPPSMTVPPASTTAPTTIPSAPVTTAPSTPTTVASGGGIDAYSEEAWSGKSGTRFALPILDATSPQIRISPLGSNSDYTQLDYSFKRMLSQMASMASREGVGVLTINDGYRTAQDQETLFRSRYEPVTGVTHYVDAADNKTYPVINWNGQTWRKKPNNKEAYAAPPGQSLHELGMAADLDLSDPKMKAWVLANADRFGLAIPDKRDEPWHIQPSYAKNISTPKELVASTGIPLERWGAGKRPDDTYPQLGFNVTAGTHSTAGINVNRWSMELLRRLKAPITVNNLQFLKSWMAAEGSGGRYNPFNIVQGQGRTTESGVYRREMILSDRNGANNPVMNYRNEAEGLDTTSEWLANPKHSERVAIVNALRDGNHSVADLAHLRNLMGGGAQPGPFAPGKYTEGTYSNIIKNDTGYNSSQSFVDTIKSQALSGIGDPNPNGPLSIPNAPTLSSTSSGLGATYNEGSTITISPVIHMNGTGGNGTVSEYDLKLMAKKIAKLIEQEANITKFRSM